MNKLFSKITLLASLGVLALGSTESQAFRLSLMGAANFSDFKQAPGSYSPVMGYGGGALIGIPMGMRMSVELGALYLQRKFNDVPTTFVASYYSLDIPVAIRFNLVKYFSIGLGGYYSMAIGDATVVVGGAPSSQTLSAVGIKGADYGLMGSFAVRIPLGKRVGLRVDGRYNYGLANISDVAGGTAKVSSILALAGFDINL